MAEQLQILNKQPQQKGNIPHVLYKAIKNNEADLYNQNITHVTNFSAAKDLVVLKLSQNNLQSLNGLEKLFKLKQLFLSKCLVVDLRPLKMLVNLEQLTLTDNKVTSLTALRMMKKMTTLYLENNQISDVTELMNLSKMRQLSRLWLQGNPILSNEQFP